MVKAMVKKANLKLDINQLDILQHQARVTKDLMDPLTKHTRLQAHMEVVTRLHHQVLAQDTNKVAIAVVVDISKVATTKVKVKVAAAKITNHKVVMVVAVVVEDTHQEVPVVVAMEVVVVEEAAAMVAVVEEEVMAAAVEVDIEGMYLIQAAMVAIFWLYQTLYIWVLTMGIIVLRLNG